MNKRTNYPVTGISNRWSSNVAFFYVTPCPSGMIPMQDVRLIRVAQDIGQIDVLP